MSIKNLSLVSKKVKKKKCFYIDLFLMQLCDQKVWISCLSILMSSTQIYYLKIQVDLIIPFKVRKKNLSFTIDLT